MYVSITLHTVLQRSITSHFSAEIRLPALRCPSKRSATSDWVFMLKMFGSTPMVSARSRSTMSFMMDRKTTRVHCLLPQGLGTRSCMTRSWYTTPASGRRITLCGSKCRRRTGPTSSSKSSSRLTSRRTYTVSSSRRSCTSRWQSPGRYVTLILWYTSVVTECSPPAWLDHVWSPW